MHSDGDLQEQWKKTISNPNQYNPKSRLYNNNHNHNNNNTPGPDYKCQCVPDFMLYMGQLAMGGASSRNGFMGSCV